MDEYTEDLKKAISSTTTHEIKRLFEDAASLTMDAVSHKICLLSRENQDDVHSRAVVAPITPSIQTRLANQFRVLEQAERIRLYRHFAKVPDSRATAGIFFEAAGQRCLQDGMTLELIPMVRLSTSRKGTRSRWYSCQVVLRNASLDASRKKALQKCLHINVKPSQTLEYSDNGPSHLSSDILYIPELTNQVALDSFILLNGILHIFQFTIGSKHDIKPGLVDFFRKLPDIPSMDKWRFVFILPPNQTVICPEPSRVELRVLHPYSAVISM
jgi:hypothetical protein